MRLDRLRVGSASPHSTHQFKNLKNVTIDFDQDHWVTVMIGWNGTGKSNVLEALAIIFRDLIDPPSPSSNETRPPSFAYQLAYRMGAGRDQRQIHIDADPERPEEPFIIHVATAEDGPPEASRDSAGGLQPPGRQVKLKTFLADGGLNLPRYVFSYYSGESRRMENIFRPYLEKYDGNLRSGLDPGLKRLFYAMPVHSQFVLLAFLVRQDDTLREVLEGYLGLDADEGLESVLFVLRQPSWTSAVEDGDQRFWNARGVVAGFLARLYDVALAPIEVRRRVATSMWNKKTLTFKYLFVKDIASLRTLVGGDTPASFFQDLESTHASELLEEVRIRVRLKKSDGTVTFRELSEGEQQLLTVLGLLRFTASEESLFLLDEPDTHLNPRWSMEYLDYLRRFVDSTGQLPENSHVVLTTHNPMAIADLVRDQVQILRNDSGPRRVVACHPEMDPRGLGYAAIVASDMFGIASTLDTHTQLLLEKQRAFGAKPELTAAEQEDLDGINAQLDRLGFRFFHPDDEYSRYLRLRNEALKAQFVIEEPKALATRVVEMSRAERETLAAKLIGELLNEDSTPGSLR